VSDQCRVLQVVFCEERLDVVGEGGISVCLVMRRFTVIACIEGIYGTAESARKCTVNDGLALTRGNDRSVTVLANTSIVLPISEEAMYDHDRVALCVSLIIVKAVR
jgi:CO dehydrogenase/acetyl-CoA synthase alpha subunit